MGAKYKIQEIPADLAEKAAEYRHDLIERVAEADDALMEKYLDGEELTVAEIKAGDPQADDRLRGLPGPLWLGVQEPGVQPMLDAVIDFLPSPLDVPADGRPRRARQRGGEVVAHAERDEPFSALAFKVASHPFFGTLTFIRVYSGEVSAGHPDAQLDQGQEGAHWQAVPDARQQGEPRRRGPRGPHLRRDRPEGHDDR